MIYIVYIHIYIDKLIDYIIYTYACACVYLNNILYKLYRVPEKEISILGDHSIGHFKQKNLYEYHTLFQIVVEIELLNFECII